MRTIGLPEDDVTTYAGKTLYYLKEYKANQEFIKNQLERLDQAIDRYQEAVKACEAAENKYKQLLGDEASLKQVHRKMLTWDELRTMKGKPVWIERKSYAEWVLITDVLQDIWYVDSYGYTMHVNRYNLGKTWKAYRKEKCQEI